MVDELEVWLNVGPAPVKVGKLVYSHQDQRSLFEYDRVFIGSGYSISPIQLPLEGGVFRADRPASPDDHRYGLHGVFADSLPDEWGRKVQDVWFRKIRVESPHPFDRLAYIGDHGMGALTFRPALKFKDTGKDISELSDLRKTAIGIVKGDVSTVTARLIRMGGSAGGMHPKFLIGFNPQTQTCSFGVPYVDGDIPSIVKIPADDAQDALRMEYAYSCMAREARIAISPTHILHRGEGSYFITRRFDIGEDGSRIHIHSLAGMLGIDYASPIIDHRQAFRLTNGLTRDNRQLQQLYRRMVFNVLVCNRDDHTKNMSFMMDTKGVWSLAPAYDLTYVATPGGRHSMSVNGTIAGFTAADFQILADEFDVKNWRKCVLETAGAVSRWPEYAADAGVSQKTTDLIGADLGKTAKLLLKGV